MRVDDTQQLRRLSEGLESAVFDNDAFANELLKQLTPIIQSEAYARKMSRLAVAIVMFPLLSGCRYWEIDKCLDQGGRWNQERQRCEMAETELSKLLELYGDLPEFVEVPTLDVKTIGNFGNTPLHVAAARGVLAEVQVLLASGADVNAVGELGNSPLHEAVGQDNFGAAEALLKAGANVGIRNDFGESPMDIAQACGRAGLGDLFEQYAKSQPE